MDVGIYFEEYTDDWSYQTGSRTITDEDITKFVELHHFYTPTFTNSQYVHGNKDYGGRMAPGLFVFCLAEGLALESGITRRRGIFLMELTPRFLKPTFAGDTIVNRVRLQSKRGTSKPDRGVVITAHDVVNQKGEVVVQYTSTRMIRTRLYVESPEASQS